MDFDYDHAHEKWHGLQHFNMGVLMKALKKVLVSMPYKPMNVTH